jgi:diguanylate cyclase (GGDEF)-like protein
VVFSAYFFPWRRSVAHLVLVAGLVGSRLAVVDGVDPNDVATFAVATISVWAAVVFLSMKQTERETHLRQSTDLLDPETGLLSPRGLDQALEAELSRAIRHARPLSLIFLEVSGSSLEATEGIESRRLTTTLARAVLSRIRTEDNAARLDRFKFAVLAPETGDNGASAMAKSLSEQVRKRLVSLGYQNSSFSVAVGWADYQYDELPRQELFKHADTSLAAAILANEGITFPPMETLARETVPELPGTH